MIIKKAQIKESGKYLTLAKRYTGYYPVLTISIDNRTQFKIYDQEFNILLKYSMAFSSLSISKFFIIGVRLSMLIVNTG